MTSKRGFLKGLLAAPAAAIVKNEHPSHPFDGYKIAGPGEGGGGIAFDGPEHLRPRETISSKLTYARYRQTQRIARKELTHPEDGGWIHGTVPEYSPYTSFKSVASWKKFDMFVSNQDRIMRRKEQDYITKLEQMLSWDEKLIYDMVKNL